MTAAQVFQKCNALLLRLAAEEYALALRLLFLAHPPPPLSARERQAMSRGRDRERDRERDEHGHAPVTDGVTGRVTDGVTGRVTPPPHSPPTHKPIKQAFSYSEGFELFWKSYPKRVGKGKAYESWNKHTCEIISSVILEAVQKQNGYLMREGGRFTPLAETWLNQRRWEDEPDLSSPLSPKGQDTVEALQRAAVRLKMRGGGDESPR